MMTNLKIITKFDILFQLNRIESLQVYITYIEDRSLK